MALLVVAGLMLGVALFNGALPLERGDLPPAPGWLAPSPPLSTPLPTAEMAEMGRSSRSPAAPAAAGPARVPAPTPAQPPAADAAPALTPPQIFAMLENGKIATEEAIALLSGESSPAPSAPVQGPPPTPMADPGPAELNAAGPPERGSAAWITLLEYEVHNQVNRRRQEEGLAALEPDQHLAAVARSHSWDMALHDYFAHENRSGQSPTDRGLLAGYRCFKDHGTHYTEGIAENLLQTSLFSAVYYLNDVPVQKTYMSIPQIAQRVVQGWMDSPGHRRNLLDANYERQGIGAAVGVDEKVYVTQNFC